MYRFQNDYSETAHPQILNKIVATQNNRYNGYGLDSYCEQAAQTIRERIKCPDADIHFFNGGTITNLTVISHTLRPYQAVISAETGHIATHETGAIEATGHKVITIKSESGKLTPELIQPILTMHSDEHWVQPKMVYITNSTEIGTVYNKQELKNLYQFCQQKDLILYLDGARLASGLMSLQSDLTIEDIAQLTDAFYIGGTKIGAMAAEAVVIRHAVMKENFRFSIKQKGALQAKGWLLGVQFLALFEDDLFFKLGRHSNEMAQHLVGIFEKRDCEFLAPPESNQIFVILPDTIAEKVTEKYTVMFVSHPKKGYSCLRFCTSWATTKQDVEEFEHVFNQFY